MSEQTELTVPAGSGDPDFDAALVEAGTSAEPIIQSVEPPPTPPAETDPDFTFATLENGEREMRLSTGQVYRGKDDAELFNQLGKAQIAASRRITELSKPPEPTPVAPPAPPPVDAAALAIADLMAPAFGAKSGAELVAAFAEQQRTAQQQQEFMASQAANYEAANFFRAVPEFSKSEADAAKIDNLLKQNNWPPTAANFEAAFHTLKAKGEFPQSSTQRTTAPKNNMPLPPTGTAPATTGKGTPTEADLHAMTPEQLLEIISSASA